jgi:prepilin-type N-terminal cleavage/methylation domain-containing protein
MRYPHAHQMNQKLSPAGDSGGFTIIELMIATLVFSVILLVITIGVLSFSNDYYRGINTSTNQNIARGVTDTVTQALQFSGGGILGPGGSPAGYFCIGNQRFQYTLGTELPSASHALYQVTDPLCGPSVPSGGHELLRSQMRLANFSITPIIGAPQMYTVTIKIAFGDDDLLCAPNSVPGSCDPGAATITGFTQPDLRCKTTIGSQFCSVSTLITTVQQRVTGS